MLCTAFLAALFIRAPQLLLSPRLWAEEGTVYYALLQQGEVHAFTLVANGNYQLVTNLAVAAALAVPARWAAHVTTGIALAIALLVIVLVSQLSLERNWSRSSLAPAVMLLALLPLGYEVYLTSTNLQWLCSATMLLLALLRVHQWTRGAQVLAMTWTALCALSGVPAVMLAPILLLASRVHRSKSHVALAFILAAGAVVQLGVILAHEHTDRAVSVDAFFLTVPALLQAVLAPVVGGDAIATLASAVNDGATAVVEALIVFGIGTAAWLISRLRITEGGGFVAIVVAAALLCICLNIFGAVGARETFISPFAGGRYFYLAAVCWILLWAALANDPNPVLRTLGLVVILGGLLANARDIGPQSAWRQFLVTGPSWKAVVEQCGAQRPCQVLVWPPAMGLTFPLQRS